MASVTSETASAVVRSSSAMLPAGTNSSTSPYIARIPPLQSSSLQTARSRAGRIRSK